MAGTDEERFMLAESMAGLENTCSVQEDVRDSARSVEGEGGDPVGADGFVHPLLLFAVHGGRG